MSRKEKRQKKKQAFSPESTERIVQTMKKAIDDPRIQKEAVSMIRALDLKKIRNTSKT